MAAEISSTVLGVLLKSLGSRNPAPNKIPTSTSTPNPTLTFIGSFFSRSANPVISCCPFFLGFPLPPLPLVACFFFASSFLALAAITLGSPSTMVPDLSMKKTASHFLQCIRVLSRSGGTLPRRPQPGHVIGIMKRYLGRNTPSNLNGEPTRNQPVAEHGMPISPRADGRRPTQVAVYTSGERPWPEFYPYNHISEDSQRVGRTPHPGTEST